MLLYKTFLDYLDLEYFMMKSSEDKIQGHHRYIILLKWLFN